MIDIAEIKSLARVLERIISTTSGVVTLKVEAEDVFDNVINNRNTIIFV